MRNKKKLNVFSFAKLQAIIMAGIGLVAGIIYSVGGLIMDSMVSLGLASPTAMSTPGLSMGTVLAFGALVGMPLIFGALGFIVGLIGAPIYNFLAKRFEAIKIEWE